MKIIWPAMVLWLLFTAAMAQGAPQPQEEGESITQQRKRLSEILERPVYQRWKLRQNPELEAERKSYLAHMARSILEDIWKGFVKFWKWIWRQVSKLNINLPNLPQGPEGISDYLRMGAWGAFAALLVVAGLYLYGLRKRLGKRILLAKVLSREKVRQALEGGEALAMDSGGWMEEAERMGAEGDFRAMYRAIYLGLLSGLHEKEIINYRKNRTNWTYVNHYKGAPEDRAEFGDLTGMFDQVWYGQKTVGGGSLEDVKARAGSLLSRGKVSI